jgi:hypothetical protein
MTRWMIARTDEAFARAGPGTSACGEGRLPAAAFLAAVDRVEAALGPAPNAPAGSPYRGGGGGGGGGGGRWQP